MVDGDHPVQVTFECKKVDPLLKQPNCTSGGSRISVRGMRQGSGPIFSEKMTPTFLRQIVSAHRRSQDFQRVGVPRGGSRISGWWTMEGPKVPNEAR